jgi:murein DD-endopeptidase MepM/ murein hydrolase activator NlpD
MSKKSYTVILVPHGGAKYRKFRLTSFRIGLIAFATGLSLIAAGVLTYQYARFHGELTELRRLRMMNAELRQQNLDYEVSTEHLSNRVASLQDFAKKLSVMAGLDTAVAGESLGGIGGPDDDELGASDSAYTQVKESLEFMAGELTALEEKGRILERFYEQNSLMLASTPSIWPVRGYLSSTFGRRNDPFTGERENHTGIDISTPTGRPVVATADGIVLYASRRGTYGNTIVIDHKYGMMTLYGHLSRYNVRPGRRVRRGDVIGYVGSTGRSRGPHVHYEVWVSGRAVHPLDYILEYAQTLNAKMRERRTARGT